jgi:hypothetical protein
MPGYHHLVPPGQTHLRPYVDAHPPPRDAWLLSFDSLRDVLRMNLKAETHIDCHFVIRHLSFLTHSKLVFGAAVDYKC